MRARAFVQMVPQVVLNGSVFANVTVFTQQITSSFLTFVNGASYYVSVRATAAGAEGLSAVATSSAVEVSLWAPPLLPQAPSEPLCLCLWRCAFTCKDVANCSYPPWAQQPLATL